MQKKIVGKCTNVYTETRRICRSIEVLPSINYDKEKEKMTLPTKK
jgi:hypothetical protein